jgi:peptidoglycan/LPS O-acetylase OafA/YrhL
VKRHAMDPFSLVAGLLFGFFAMFFLVGDHSATDLTWPWAAIVPLMALGLLAVMVGLRRALVRGDAGEPATDGEPEDGLVDP